MNTTIRIISWIGFVIFALLAGYLYWYQEKKLIEMRVATSSCLLGQQHDCMKKIVLDNGLTVLLYKNVLVPKIFLQITYGVGSAYEDVHEKGIAHAVEHMLFKGTQKLAERDVRAIVRKLGARMNATTLWDFTLYYVEAMKNSWQPFISVFADCMHNARFDEQAFMSEKKAILQELKIAREANNRRMFEHMFELGFPPQHPYHFCIGGYKEIVAKMTTSDLKKFYQKYYRPDNAVLFVVGDFDFAEAERFIRLHFGSIKKPTTPLQPVLFPAHVERSIAMQTRYYGNINKAQFAYYWIIPGLKDEHELESSVLEFLLGNKLGKFYHTLVEKEHIAYNVRVNASKQLAGGLFIITLTPTSNNYERCYQVVMRELEHIFKEGFSVQEIKAAVKHKERAFYERMFNLERFTQNWSKSYFSTNNETLFFARPNRYASVTEPMLMDFIKRYIDPLLMHRLEVLPVSRKQRVLSAKINRRVEGLDKKMMNKLQHRSFIKKRKSYVQSIQSPPLPSFSFPTPDKIIELQNGLRIFLSRRSGVSLINIEFGFIDHDYLTLSQDGIVAQLLLTSLFERESARDARLFLMNNGVDYRAHKTGLSFAMLNRDFEENLKKIIEIMLGKDISADLLATIKKRFINSYESKKNNPFNLLKRTIYHDLFQDHLYGWTFKDAIQRIASLTNGDMEKAYKTFINGHAMSVAIVGDFNLEQMQKTVQTLFDRLPSGVKSTKKLEMPHACELKDKDLYLSNNLILLALASPSLVTIQHPDFSVVKLLDYARRIKFSQLREDFGLFYSSFGGLAVNAERIPGFNYMGASFEQYALESAEKLIRANFKAFIKNGINREDLSVALQLYIKSLMDKVSSNAAMARSFTYLASLNLDFDYFDKQYARVRNISLDEVNRVAAKYCNPDAMSRIRIGRIQSLLKKEKK